MYHDEAATYLTLEDLKELQPPAIENSMTVRYLSYRLRAKMTDRELQAYIQEKGRLADIQLQWGRTDRKYREYVAAARLALRITSTGRYTHRAG